MKKIKFLIKRFVLVTFAGLVYKYVPIRFPPVPSVSAIITKGKDILVVKLTYKNGYEIPGGVLQKGESFQEALVREVYEETGLKVKSFKYFGSYKANDDHPVVNNTYVVKAVGTLRDSKEGTPMWVNPKEIFPQLVFSDNKQAVKDFLRIKNLRSM